jgi:hypothetical protein
MTSFLLQSDADVVQLARGEEPVVGGAKEDMSQQQQRMVSEQNEKELDEKIRKIRQQNALLEERRRQALAEESNEETKNNMGHREARTSSSRGWRDSSKSHAASGSKPARLLQGRAYTPRGRGTDRRAGLRSGSIESADDGWRTVKRSNRT